MSPRDFFLIVAGVADPGPGSATPATTQAGWRRAFGAALLAIALLGAPPVRADVKVGDTFPALASAGLVGGTVPATAGRVVLVDFWASWCAPCKASFPAYARLHAEYAPRGLVIAAVSVDEKSRDYEAFVRKLAPAFPTVLDLAHSLVNRVNVPVMPTTYLLGRDGRVRFIHAGFHGDATERELHAEIETLLSEKNSSS